jgi:hypothetical protein
MSGISQSVMDNINPYHVLDGKWGGWGQPMWFVFPAIHPKNVFEVGFLTKGKQWVRVWDCDANSWRDVTPEEHQKLPTP